MIARRTLLQLAGASATAAVGGGFSPEAEASPKLRVSGAIYDARLEEGQLFAREARRLGMTAMSVGDDVTGVYRTSLAPSWAETPGPIVGLTTYSSWFVLDMMARGPGLRTLYWADHGQPRTENPSHAVFGPRAVLAEQGTLEQAGVAWPLVAVRLLAGLPRELCASRERSTIAYARDRSTDPRTLVSWLIAPASPGSAIEGVKV